MKIIEYEEIKLIKQSEKSTVLLVREKNGEQVLVKKILKGQHPIYSELRNCTHPYLPKLYEVIISDDTTTIIEEYIDGQSLGSAELSEKQIVQAVGELCSVLEFLHGKDIIHRDIKPSNIILAKDGHIRLIDFDAARMPKEDLEQDTKLLGTRGYAPPEQYGFSQTDARADIYSLGVTMDQLLGDKAHKARYKKIIGKCTNLNPDKRYQSARQVKRAFSSRKRSVLYAVIGMILLAVLWYTIPLYLPVQQEEVQSVSTALEALPAPENPHWNGDTGVAVWGNVPDSGSEGQAAYNWRLYFSNDAENPQDVLTSIWRHDGFARSGWEEKQNLPQYEQNLATQLWENGYYYFAVSAVGDTVNYADSPYVMSDAFHFTGEDAPLLPTPTGLEWKVIEDEGQQHFATWSNLDDYADTDSFNARVYNQEGIQVMNNIWSKADILSIGHGGIWFEKEIFEEAGSKYRFTVQVQTSRPNEFKSSPMPNPVPEEYFSPWYDTTG